jgi:hypothetical protein
LSQASVIEKFRGYRDAAKFGANFAARNAVTLAILLFKSAPALLLNCETIAPERFL